MFTHKEPMKYSSTEADLNTSGVALVNDVLDGYGGGSVDMKILKLLLTKKNLLARFQFVQAYLDPQLFKQYLKGLIENEFHHLPILTTEMFVKPNVVPGKMVVELVIKYREEI